MVEINESTTKASPTTSISETVHPHENQPKSDQIAKRKRNPPGMPDPDAEIIAMSPKSLLATNRFVCEICNKGFQRDQNLQLHMRGHSLPWKLKQRASTDVVRKRVYVCPVPTCVHHDPSRALGDLTGIKKHYSRKHGEKKFKCERCSKEYAVRSDWKAHMKTCGTREYRCDCGTLFSRRDSFITHRAFCDALAQEIVNRRPPFTVPTSVREDSKSTVVTVAGTSSPPPPPFTPSTGVLSPVLLTHSSAELPDHQPPHIPPQQALSTSVTTTVVTATSTSTTTTIAATSSATSGRNLSRNENISPNTFKPSTSSPDRHHGNPESSWNRPSSSCSDILRAMSGSVRPNTDPISLSLSSSLYETTPLFLHNHQQHYVSSPQAALSATALLQKAAQIGATSSSSSILRGLGLTMSSSSSIPQYNSCKALTMASGLKLGLPSNASPSGSGFNEFMMGQSSMFCNIKPPTLDFLGLGLMGAGSEVFLSSITGGLDLENASLNSGETWDDDALERKPSIL